MDNFELQTRYTALKMIELWAEPLLKNMTRLNDNDTYRFGLKCKTRGMIAHDRVLTGRIV